LAISGKHVAAAEIDKGVMPSENGLLPKRPLGRTGEQIGIIGFPGNGFRHCDQQEATNAIRRATDRGVNYFDVAPAYGKDGECEIKMGVGLQGLRDNVFLASKTKRRDGEGAREELERSLKRLKTDHLDLYQLHFLSKLSEVEQAFGPGGAMETILKAQKEGKLRYIGFSAHTTIAAMEAMDQFKFDTVMYPINFVEHFSFGFGQAVLERAHSQGAGVLAIKATSGGAHPSGKKRSGRKWWYQVIDDKQELNLALRYSLSQKNVAAAIPASFMDHLDNVLASAMNIEPITPEDLKQLHNIAKTRLSVFMEQQKRGLMGWRGNPHDEGCEMC